MNKFEFEITSSLFQDEFYQKSVTGTDVYTNPSTEKKQQFKLRAEGRGICTFLMELACPVSSSLMPHIRLGDSARNNKQNLNDQNSHLLAGRIYNDNKPVQQYQ